MSHCRAGLLAFLALSVLGVARAEAATLTVVNANDSGAGSLRDALANAATSGDTIAFASSLTGATITLTTSDPLTWAATNPQAPFGPTGLVVLGKDVTIDGSGAPGLSISGNNAQRIFAVTGLGGNGFNPPATPGVLRLVNITLTAGFAVGGDGLDAGFGGSGGGAGLGGGIFVDSGGRVSLVGCLISACVAQGGVGGFRGSTTPSNENSSGGGLAGPGGPNLVLGGPPNGASLTASAGFGGGGTDYPAGFGGGAGTGGYTPGGFGGGGGGDATGGLAGPGTPGFGGSAGAIVSPIAKGGGGAGMGGGIFTMGSLEATNTTITGCAARGSGGNPGAGMGGALFQLNGSVTLTFCTLEGIAAGSSAAGDALGVVALGGTTSTTISSSILAATPTAPFGTDLFGIVAAGMNGAYGSGNVPVSGDGKNVMVLPPTVAGGFPTQAGFSPAIGTIPGNADPILLPLASNGGPTQTRALGIGSPAHDSGNAAITTLTAPLGAGGVDQRGLPRRVGVTDVGAYETQPVDVSLLAGGGQTTTVGTAFGVALVFSATDPLGAGLGGVPVTLKPPANGASALFVPSPLVTNASGLATAYAVANTKPGSYGVALVGSSTPFSLTNTAGAPASLSVVSGGGQTTLVSTAFAQPLVLEVTDSFGNPLGGVALTLAPPSSGASASLSSTSVTTGSNGQVSVTATANATGGTYTVNANGPGISASFPLTNSVPASTPVLSGGGQSVAVGTAFGTPIVIRVTDASGSPIAGVTVTLTAPTSGASASFSPASLVTDATGKVSALATANGTAGGPYTVTITAGSVTSTFELTNLASTGGSGGGSSSSGGGSHGGSGCVVGGRPQSPGSLAPLLLALVGLVGRRRRASS